MNHYLPKCLIFDLLKRNMNFKNQFIAFSLKILFFVLIGTVYSVLTSINPFPIVNILLWMIILWLFKSTIKDVKKHKKRIGLIFFLTLLLGYLILGVKSAFFIAEFNQVYLSAEELGSFPNNWSTDTVNALLSYSAWFNKVSFAFNQESFYYSFGNTSMSLGIPLTKTLKCIEIFGLAIFAGLRLKK